MDKFEREMRKANYVFKKNKRISSIENNVISFARTLSSEQLGLLVLKLVTGLAKPMYKKQLHKLLKESVDNETNEAKEFIDELIAYIDELNQENMTAKQNVIKVRDLLKN
jgi:hypothetical protein